MNALLWIRQFAKDFRFGARLTAVSLVVALAASLASAKFPGGLVRSASL